MPAVRGPKGLRLQAFYGLSTFLKDYFILKTGPLVISQKKIVIRCGILIAEGLKQTGTKVLICRYEGFETMKKKNRLRLIIGIGIYLALLCLFSFAESPRGAVFTDPALVFSSLGSAVWYSLVTLTTVGYGDVVPHSLTGKLIGGFFALFSTFLLAFLIGIMLSLLRGRLLPIVRLKLSRGKNWYIFKEKNHLTGLLGNSLKKNESGCMVIFSGDSAGNSETSENGGSAEIQTDLNVADILRLAAGRNTCTVFCMDDNGYENYQRAASLMSKNVNVCCMTGYEPDRYPASLILFNPYISCARTYWRQYPVSFSGETIVMIGSGKYVEALLEQALMVNVFSPEQCVRYLVYGDFHEFRKNHPRLSLICAGSCVQEKSAGPPSGKNASTPGNTVSTRDVLLFKDTAWNEDAALFASLTPTDRILLCFDREEETLAAYNTLHKYIPTPAAVHARLSHAFDRLITFGSPKTLFSSENVLRKELDRQAMTLHQIYLDSSGKTSPKWDELSAFLRRSNIASADHLFVKVRILLGEKTDHSEKKDCFAPAFQKWQEEWPVKKDLFRWIEHERWMRFYLLNNWQYAEKRDDAMRLHPMIRPFDCLPEEEQAKDDYAWEMLGELGKYI